MYESYLEFDQEVKGKGAEKFLEYESSSDETSSEEEEEDDDESDLDTDSDLDSLLGDRDDEVSNRSNIQVIELRIGLR